MPDVQENEHLREDDRHHAKTQVAISESILRWAMNRSGRNEEDLESAFPKISQWLKGDVRPTLRELEKLSTATSTPLGFFFLPTPPNEQLSIPHFRTIGNHDLNEQTSPDLIDTIQLMERRQGWLREHLMEQSSKPLSFVHSSNPRDAPDVIAGMMRQTLGLSDNWASEQTNWGKALQVLRESIEDAGIIVVVSGIVGNNTHRKLDVSEFRGFVLVDEYAPLVFVNGADGKAAQMFTLAHELAHIWFGKSAIFDLKELRPANDLIERASNSVAAEFLVPAKSLRAIWPASRVRPEHYQDFARHFKVSELVIAYRALNLGLISDDDFTQFYYDTEQRQHDTIKKSEGGDFYATMNLRVGRRFALIVISAAKEGKLLYRDAYHLIGLHGETFDNYVKRLGLG
jgi:Zn-dependent peptidase ImmA (M78 family)